MNIFRDFLISRNYMYNLFINQPLKVKLDYYTHLENEGIYRKKP